MRVALNDAAPLYRDAPEAKKQERQEIAPWLFMQDVLTDTSEALLAGASQQLRNMRGSGPTCSSARGASISATA